MRDIRIDSLIDFIRFIADLSDRAVAYRGATDPVAGMTPRVVRSWRHHRSRRRGEAGSPPLPLWVFEARLVEAFQRHALPFLERMPASHLEWLAVAQHYELPTRLLDWTRNPLIALYFAASARGVTGPPESWPDVFVFAWEMARPAADEGLTLPLDRLQAMVPAGEGLIADRSAQGQVPSRLRLFTPPTLSPRIASQEGLFSFEDRLTETPFPDLAEAAGLALTRIRVPGTARLDILRHLDRLGVETGRLFPDLPGLCAHQTWVAEWLW